MNVAVEIQWSPQTTEETLRRHERYRISGIRALWLLQKTVVPTTKELPAATVSLAPDQTYIAGLSSGQKMPVQSLLEAAFSGRLKFGVPTDVAGTVSVRVAPTRCWHDRCRAEMDIITGIDIAFGPYRREFSLSQFSGEPDMLGFIAWHMPKGLSIGALKPRFSKTLDASYLSNGCFKCDRLFGEHFEIFARYDEEVVCTIPIRATPAWLEFHGGSMAWGVFGSEELASTHR